jgi:hypothetical protein
MVTQADVARRAGVDLSTVNRILNQRRAHKFRESTVRRVLEAARRLRFNLNRLRYFHRRRAERLGITINCSLSVRREDGTVFDQGRCIIRNLSPHGALITGVTFGRESLPLGTVRLVLHPLEGPLRGVDLCAKIVRHEARNGVGYGVLMDRRQSGVTRKLAEAMNAAPRSSPPRSRLRAGFSGSPPRI